METVPIVKITRQGLSAMTLSVALLWGCVIGERVLWHRASAGQARALHDIELLRHRCRQQPVSTPVPLPRRPLHPVAA